jgi:hypothetical protein
MHSAVICALHKKRSQPASFLAVPNQPATIGSTGSRFASRSSWIRTSKTSKTPSRCSKYISNGTALAPSHPVASLSELEQWRIRYVPLARRSRHWGPRTHAETSTATSTSTYNANSRATQKKIQNYYLLSYLFNQFDW